MPPDEEGADGLPEGMEMDVEGVDGMPEMPEGGFPDWRSSQRRHHLCTSRGAQALLTVTSWWLHLVNGRCGN